jgi:hypothetical protein
MNTLPKNKWLIAGTIYVCLACILMIGAEIYKHLPHRKYYSDEDQNLFIEILRMIPFIYTAWISILTFQVFSGKGPRDTFEGLDKSAMRLMLFMMIFLYLQWFGSALIIFDSSLKLRAIAVSAGILIFPLHLLNLYFHIRNNKLTQESDATAS